MEAELFKAFSAHLKPIAQTLNVKVYDPLKALPTDDKTHWRLTLQSVEPEVLELCNGGSRYIWIAQIAVYMRDGQGALVFDSHLEALRTALPYNTTFLVDNFTFKTTKPIYAASPVTGSSGWVFRPVQCRIQTIH